MYLSLQFPKLYEPVEDRYAVIEDVSNLYFEWEKAQAEDNSVVYYDILFDKLDGDFSNPIYIYQADGNWFEYRSYHYAKRLE